MSYKQTYKLLAQTPILHFQHYEYGACLRATEVKTRLDRFLLSREDIPEDWMNNRTRRTLNYQIRIIAAEDLPDIPHNRACKASFAKDFGMVYRNCTMEIICFIPQLQETIHRHIKDFFILCNFGSRQTKGFGSFLVEGTEEAYIEKVLASQYPHGFSTSISGSVTDLLNAAYGIYKVLRCGVNIGDSYVKGYAIGHFLPQGIGSEKAFLKSHIFPADDGRDYPRDGYAFIRALLGFCEVFQFHDQYRNSGESTRINKKNNQPETIYSALCAMAYHYEGTRVEDGKLSIPLESIIQDRGIRRFPSPILIKIIGQRIWFLLGDSWKLMLNQTFLLQDRAAFWPVNDLLREKKYTEAQKLLEQFPHISTPAEFDPDAFLTGFIDYFHSPQTQAALRTFPPMNPAGFRQLPGCEMNLITACTLKKL